MPFQENNVPSERHRTYCEYCLYCALAMLRRCWYWRYQKTLSGQFPGCLLGAMLSGTGRMGRAMMGMEVSARWKGRLVWVLPDFGNVSRCWNQKSRGNFWTNGQTFHDSKDGMPEKNTILKKERKKNGDRKYKIKYFIKLNPLPGDREGGRALSQV